MRFLGRLLRNVLAVLVAGSLVAWWAFGTAFPIGPAVREALRTAFLVAIAAELALAAAAIALVAAPLRRASAAGWKVGEEAGAAAARAGGPLPVRAAAIVTLASCLGNAAAVLAMRAAGLPLDLALAASAVGAATAILSGMLAYSAAASAAARAAAELGAREVAVSGTVRGKILVLGFGLNTIGVLAFAATGYVRYRGDVDREYVAAAVRAQASAIAASPAAGAELARHVWLETRMPTALLASDGAIRARAGEGAPPFAAAGGAHRGVVRAEDGWLVTAAAPGGLVAASWLPETPLWPRRKEFWIELARAGLAVYAATAVLAWLAARAIALPLRTLGRAADRIASGDLTAGPPSMTRDEMGLLAAQFRRMADGLKALVQDVQSASDGVSAGAREAAAIGEEVRSGALDERAGVLAMQAAVEAMEGSVQLVSRGVSGLSDYVAATTRAVSEMAEAFEAVERKGGELRRAMEAALVDVEQLATSGRDAEDRLQALDALAAHAGESLGTVRASVPALERAASESEATAAEVAETSERAGGVVGETVHGIEALRAAVSDARRRVAALAGRSDDIGQVVDFIDEVAKRTNLLSLNASIIASQAGEHGKAFAVVAEQIRELAAQIARSSKSIDDIVHSVREEVDGTTALIERGDALAIEGVHLARSSLEALGQIQRSTARGRETAAAIRAAVEVHGRASREVSQVVEAVTNGSRAVAAAVQLVGRSVTGVSSVSKGMNELADQVATALVEQAGRGRRQIESLARLERMIADIDSAVQGHDVATRRVRDSLQTLSRTASEHERAVDGLSGVAERLGARARALADGIGRFKV